MKRYMRGVVAWVAVPVIAAGTVLLSVVLGLAYFGLIERCSECAEKWWGR